MSDDLKARVMNLLDDQITAVLSTSNQGKSYSCLVSFAVTEGFRDIVFATKRERLKYRNMIANPSVSILIDNRENKPSDFRKTTSVTIVGSVEDIRTKDMVRLSRILLEKHPYLREFVESPDTAMMRVFANKIYIVDEFEDVKIISIKDD